MAHYTGPSIVDFLNSTGQDSSFSRRAHLAVQAGIVSNASQYTGSGDQNTRLLNTLKTQHNAQAVPIFRTPEFQPKSIFGTQTTTPATTFTPAQPPAQTSLQPVPPQSVAPSIPQPTRLVPPATPTQAQRTFPDGTVFKFPDNNRYFIKKGDQLVISFVSPGVFGDAPKDFGPEWAPNAVNITREELAKYGNFAITSIQTPNMLKNLGGIPNPVPAPSWYQPAPPAIPGPSTQLGQEPQAEGQMQGDVFKQMGQFYGELYGVLKQFLDEIQKRGQSINPEISITPERVAEFMHQAQNDIKTFMPYVEKEILPYYETQLKLAREGFLTSLGYSQDELLRSETDLERKYQKSVQQTGEAAAERGFALSGVREREEKELAGETQEEIETGRRRFGFGVGKAAREFAQQFGTAQLPAPRIPTAPTVLPGEAKFARPAREQPVYELSPEVYSGLVGEKEFEKRAALRTRAAELEQAFRTEQAIGQQRKITI